jgi:hypothetical protein
VSRFCFHQQTHVRRAVVASVDRPTAAGKGIHWVDNTRDSTVVQNVPTWCKRHPELKAAPEQFRNSQIIPSREIWQGRQGRVLYIVEKEKEWKIDDSTPKSPAEKQNANPTWPYKYYVVPSQSQEAKKINY